MSAAASYTGAGGTIAAYVRLEGPRLSRLREVLITGDFFVTPPRIVFDLESALRGVATAELRPAVERFFGEARRRSAERRARRFRERDRGRHRGRHRTTVPMKLIHVVQHTSAEYLGLIEDHLEGRGIRFRYHRPFTSKGTLPPAGRASSTA